MKILKMIRMLMSLICVVTMLSGTAQAALQAVGPVDPVSTLPTYYQDTTGLALQLCLDQNGFCLLGPPFDPAFPPVSTITTTPGSINDANFPGESFYFSAQAIMPIEGGELANLAFVMEAAFLSGVSPDGGITFLRTDLQKMQNLALNATYRVTHPYGTFEFTTDALGNTTGGGGVAVRLEDGPAVPAQWLPAGMKNAVNTNIGPFLLPASFPVTPLPTALVGTETHTYIGDGATAVAVSGSPTGNNFFRIDRIAGGTGPSSWQTDLFVLMGRVFTGQIPSPMAIDRVTYARDAAGAGQVDAFATALPTAALSISGTGLAATPIPQDLPNTGKFFAHIPVATLPTGVTITNSLDAPSIPYPVTLVDEVIISQASFNPVTGNLTIKADSRDDLAPLPTLTVPQFGAPNTLDATGTLVKAIAATTIPPQSVTVTSSKGGSATLAVSVVTAAVPPVAVDDATSTNQGLTVVINVIGNDTASSPATINPASLLITAPSGGSASANIDGTITYTAPAASGSYTLTYTVADSTGIRSNTATLTVTVSAPAAATGVTAVATPDATQAIDNLVTITATGTGGNGQYEYRFYVNDGGTFYLIQPYSTSNTCTWLPGKAGTYDFFVEVRSAGSTVLRDAFINIFAYVVTSPAATGVYLSADSHSPQAANAPVTFTAQGVGGTGVNEYRFWLNSGAGYVVVQPYSTVNTWTWTPTVVGFYDMFVEVRKVGSPVNRDAFNAILAYEIQ